MKKSFNKSGRRRVSRGFPPEFIEKVKSQNDIVSVLSRFLRLEKKGKDYWACCPFHSEKTPSFAISEMEQFYHCYGCGESGDVIKFVQKYENMTFVEAIKKLAQDANIPLPEFADNTQELENLRKKEKVLQALRYAKEYYCDCLSKNNGVAKNYVIKRGFTAEIVKYFGIGYSKDWQGLIDFLHSKGVSDETMVLAGLIDKSQNSGNYYDVFATRLTFPIFNQLGDCIGFTARTLEANPEFAKYRNSTQTIVFDKSRTVYNIHTVRELKKVQNLDYVIICEGTVDVIAMYKSGFKNTVACMGTAITPLHGTAIKRLVNKVVLCLDGDSAGQKAMYKAIDVLSSAGLEVRVVTLREKLDPDEFLKKYGAEELKKCIDGAIDGIEYKICSLEKQYNLKDNFEKNKFVEACFEILRGLNTNAEREIYLKILSEKSNISQDILRRDMVGANLASQEPVPNLNDGDRIMGSERASRFVLASIVKKEPYAIKALEKNLKFKNSTYQNLFDFLKKCQQEGKVITVSSLFDYFDIEHNSDLSAIVGFNFDEIGDKKEEYYEKCIQNIDTVDLKARQQQLLADYKSEKDLTRRREIAKELNQVAKEIKNGEKYND